MKISKWSLGGCFVQFFQWPSHLQAPRLKLNLCLMNTFTYKKISLPISWTPTAQCVLCVYSNDLASLYPKHV